MADPAALPPGPYAGGSVVLRILGWHPAVALELSEPAQEEGPADG